MAGITDVVFRQLCIEKGADLTFTEMVSAKGLSFANEKTRHLVKLAPCEKRVAVQIFGHEPDILAKEAQWLSDELGEKLALIDVNMGCPARKIVKKGDGCALMLNPSLAADIISKMKASTKVAITAKFRRGFYEGEENAVDFAKRLEEAGADAVTVHGRYAMQMYRGESSNACIARVKGALSIPVVGNGDIKSQDDAKRMIAETACDAIMLARASLGNPWIFEELKAGLDTNFSAGSKKDVSVQDRLAMMDRHAKMLDEAKDLNIKKMRKLASYYIKGIDGAAKAREAFSHCCTYDDFKDLIDMIYSRL